MTVSARGSSCARRDACGFLWVYCWRFVDKDCVAGSTLSSTILIVATTYTENTANSPHTACYYLHGKHGKQPPHGVARGAIAERYIPSKRSQKKGTRTSCNLQDLRIDARRGGMRIDGMTLTGSSSAAPAMSRPLKFPPSGREIDTGAGLRWLLRLSRRPFNLRAGTVLN